MKKYLYIILISSISTIISAEEKKPNCDTALSKLKPSCNIIGTGVTKLKEFSSKNRTLDQSLRNIEGTIEKGIEKIKK